MGFFSRLFGSSASTSQKADEVVARIKGPGTFSLDIVGESYHQDVLEEVCGGRTPDGHRKEIEVLILNDDQNPHDNKAVAVCTADGRLVGHLSRKHAREYRKRMAEAGAGKHPALCQALVVGGWDRGNGDTGNFGVKLDIPME